MDLSLRPQRCHHFPHAVGAAGKKQTHFPHGCFQWEAAALLGGTDDASPCLNGLFGVVVFIFPSC